MTEKELVEKLREMREDGGRKDVMTRLFGLLFDHEIGKIGKSGPKKIADEYNRMGHVGKVNDAIIKDGRNLAEFVDPHYNVIRRWRG